MAGRPAGTPLLPNCPHPQHCDGVLEDGYCSVCGLAPPAGVRIAAAPARPVAITGGASVSAPLNTASRSARSSTSLGPRTTASTSSTGSSRSSRSARSVRSARTGSGRSSRRLGGGYVALPPVPPADPVATLVSGVVPERKRFCSNCGHKLTRDAGFCPKCGQEYSFVPSLKPGDIVAGKYEVKGTMAFGGLGWIYLAWDTQLARWVVMKGLLNVKDPAMAQIAVHEREYLAAVKQSNIVAIYDFITSGGEGFIVMEYVNGKTLLNLRREHNGPLPAWEACAYLINLLPAFGYLDERGLVYCDFKPENAMVETDGTSTIVKLIDMGAVRRADDLLGDVFGSKGYTAPEASDDPTPVSDLYSVARALAVLLVDFDFQGQYEYSLPSDEDVPLFQQHASLYRFLLKATRPNRDERFQTAEEMAEQLVGVLREIVIDTEQDSGPVQSAVFAGDGVTPSGRLTATDRVQSLPAVKIDPKDPLAAAVLNAAATPDPARRYTLFEDALRTTPDSAELQTRQADALLAGGYAAEALDLLDRYKATAEPNWRYDWYRGRALLTQERAADAADAFDAVFSELPGELAPKLALAHAFEMLGDLPRATILFDLVSRADPGLTTAAFGLARALMGTGDRAGASAAFTRVPQSSSQYEPAQIGRAQALLASDHAPPGAPELLDAAAAVEALGPARDTLEVRQLSARLLKMGAEMVEAGKMPPDAARQVLGTPLTARALRQGAERDLRACARFAAVRTDKIRFVDEANRVRPRTLI